VTSGFDLGFNTIIFDSISKQIKMILESNPFEEPKRSQFLTVLCILSFIMCGFRFIVWYLGNLPKYTRGNAKKCRASESSK
jgi:hypothetical protein